MTSRRKKWLIRLLLAYLVLLGLSHLKRWVDPVEARPAADQETFEARGYGEDEGEIIEIAYRDTGPANGIPLLLIHGSPVGASVFDALVAALPPDLRIIAPDLPGHGNSDRQVRDGSFNADADYLHQLLQALDIASVHLVAYSRGGGPALQFADRYPDEVRSLTLLSSIGVQEQELLGNYTLNHALHSLQFWFFVLVEELIPHFGALDDAILNSDYARSFSDSDQRPLRKILSQTEVPTLIVHGTRDPLVPISAAREHRRIIPQSELEEMPGGHLLLLRQTDRVAGKIHDFIGKTEAGTARIRAEASPARLLAAAQAQAENPAPPVSGTGLLFLALILFLATFASEDLTCILAGILAAAGTLSYPVATLACFVGIMVGDMIIFFSGRLFGAKAVRHVPFRWVLTEERLAFAQRWFLRRGAVVIFTTRFIPGSRLAAYFAAGMIRAHTFRFLLYFVIAAAVWTPLVVGLAMLVGNPLMTFLTRFEHWALPALIGVVLLLLFLTKVIAPLFTWRGRRIAYGAWRRRVRWEFWPRWVFYPPVVLWVLWLGLRYRCPSLFTATNPGIEAGGIAFESKRMLYERLAAGKGKIAHTHPLSERQDSQTWMKEVEAAVARGDFSFPVVCKPDYGERGDGVSIVEDGSQLPDALEAAAPAPILQEFVPGLEYGIFYEKSPSESSGAITSITRKIHTSVTGDGERTLEELILCDPRAVCSYPYFRERHRDQLQSVPASGEAFELAPLGSHCRGSLFLNGADLLTPQLTAAIEAVFDGTEGLCFGRLDLKCPSDEDLMAGRNLTVLEFNGVTSEPTHIYDPGLSLMNAYRTLFAQWQRAFALAAANRDRGHPPLGSRKTLRLILAALRGRTE